jgi:uracil phosphoribosyltransferase
MGMSLRVVVPPHPLLAHWLTVLRDRHTPGPLFGTAMAELGRWLTYEALRDWLPQRSVTVETPLDTTEGSVVDASVPLLAIPVLTAGLGLWQGARDVLPAARLAHLAPARDAAPRTPRTDEGEGPLQWSLDTLPEVLERRLGVLVYLPEIASGRTALAVLERLRQLGVEGDRLRLITTLASAAGLQALGERAPQQTIYCSGIDPQLDPQGRLVPGFGDAATRLFGGPGG